MLFAIVSLLVGLATEPDASPSPVAAGAYCVPLVDVANATIKLVQDNDERLAKLETALNTATFDTSTIIVKKRTIDALAATGVALQKATVSAGPKIQQLRDLANAPGTDDDKRVAIDNLAKALEAALDRQYRIGVDTVRATVIYGGRQGGFESIAAMNGLSRHKIAPPSQFPNGTAGTYKSPTLKGMEDDSFTSLPAIYPEWKEGSILNQGASFEKTMREIGDEFAGRIQLVNAFEGLAALYADHASERCLEPPAKIQQRAESPR